MARPARPLGYAHRSTRGTIEKVLTTEYAARHPALPPVQRPGDRPDARRLLTSADGVHRLPECAATLRPAPAPGSRQNCYLWVIIPDAVPVVLETGEDVQPPPLSMGVAKHTNLTGGGPACCGGELWLDSVDAYYFHVTGGSGRYGARSPQQLADAVHVFEQFGFAVRSAGWSDENDCPERVFR